MAPLVFDMRTTELISLGCLAPMDLLGSNDASTELRGSELRRDGPISAADPARFGDGSARFGMSCGFAEDGFLTGSGCASAMAASNSSFVGSMCQLSMNSSSSSDRALLPVTASPPESTSRQSKSMRTSPPHFNLWQARLNSGKVTEPLWSPSSVLKQSLTEPKLVSAQSLKDSSSSALGGSYSRMVITPEASPSRTRQAAPVLPSKRTFLLAARNSLQEILLELSVSKHMRHARRGCLYCATSKPLNSSHATGSGSAKSHSGARHLSSHSRSRRSTTPQPIRSSEVKTSDRISLLVASGQPRACSVREKGENIIFLSDAQPLASCFFRAATASSWSQTATQEPRHFWHHLRKPARATPRSVQNSSNETLGSSSRLRTSHRATTLMLRSTLRQ
mmetsp:Transcript_72288/g.186435  ORF Transcript_72288/g.186435 Transcript_72288/m.186435 type:complete len:393 (-) Transcript_72288:133-1311(-)